MAATVSSVWAKPGAWALDSEQHEEELANQHQIQSSNNNPVVADFPSLAAAAVAKPAKKKKAQTLSLAEFTTYSAPSKQADPARLTQDELMMLPTGPRQRTADEMDRSRLGGGFRNYGGGDGGSRARVSERREGYNGNSGRGERDAMGPSRADEVDDWSKTKKFGSFGSDGHNGNSNRGERDMGPSRADEVDDWSKGKKFGSFGGDRPERREKVGFFNSSKADEVDNWAAGKSFNPAPVRERRMGFEGYSNGSGPDSETWGRRREERTERAVDSETWGRRKEEGRENGNGVGRPRLNLQPRTLPVASNGQADGGKVKGSNPFGEARPREQVLAEKGQDWKEIEEKLEAVKIKEVAGVGGGDKGEGFGRRRGFGMGRSDSGDERTVKSWRKPESDDVVPTATGSSAEITENNTEEPENADSAENVSEEN